MKRLLFSRKLAIAAIILCSLATINALFPDTWAEPFTIPLLAIGVGAWLISVVWFLWGWLQGANEESNERRGINASSYILAFLPLCYCYLLATDKARTKIEVEIENVSSQVFGPVKVYGDGTIFLKPDTLTLVYMKPKERRTYEVKAATSPHMKGVIRLEAFVKGRFITREIAGPFSIVPMNLKQDWKVKIDDDFLNLP